MKDKYTIRAKSSGLRARSAYKLFQINDKFHLIKKGDSVLDVGCGTGEYYDVTDGVFYGIDLDKKYIDFANNKFKNRRDNIRFEDKDLNDLNPKDKKRIS